MQPDSVVSEASTSASIIPPSRYSKQTSTDKPVNQSQLFYGPHELEL